MQEQSKEVFTIPSIQEQVKTWKEENPEMWKKMEREDNQLKAKLLFGDKAEELYPNLFKEEDKENGKQEQTLEGGEETF